MVRIADTLKLICEAGNTRGFSNPLTIYPNYPTQLFTILPGESLMSGSPHGRINAPQPQIAGRDFNVAVYLVDDWFNPVQDRSDSVYFDGSDSFARLNSGPLNNGSGIFPVTFRTAGQHYLIAKPSLLSSIATDTSNSFSVIPGPYSQILLLLPGETILPGDTATLIYKTPGKTKTQAAQYVKEPFPVRVYSTDSFWNRATPAEDDTVLLSSDFAFSASPEKVSFQGVDSVTFSVIFDATGDNQNLWAYTLSGKETYRNTIDIDAKTEKILVIYNDTIRAGEITEVVATIYDINDQPIKEKLTKFSVIKGNGVMLDSLGITDTTGVVRARFICEPKFGSELDTIRINADDYTKNLSIFTIGDSAVMAGKTIAFPNPFGYNQNFTEIQYYLNKGCNISFAIYDPFGNPVLFRKYPQGNEGGKSGLNKVIWDGRDDQGHKVVSGVYLIKLWGLLHTRTIFNQTYRIGVVW